MSTASQPATTTSSAPRLGRKGEAQLRIDPKSLRPLRRLVPFILRYRGRLALTLVFLLIAALSTLVIPALAGKVVDLGFVEKNLDMMTRYGWVIVGVAAIVALASAARFYFVSVLGERVLTDLRRAVFDHLLTLDATFYDMHRVGELTSRLNGDVATIRGAIGSSLSMTLRGTVTIIGAVALMFLTSWWLALAVVIIAPEHRVDEIRTHISKLAQLLPFVIDREGAHVTIHEGAGATAWQS